MAVLMRMDWAELTPAKYDELRKVVDWEGDKPPGGMSHVAAFDDAGVDGERHVGIGRAAPGVPRQPAHARRATGRSARPASGDGDSGSRGVHPRSHALTVDRAAQTPSPERR